MKNVLFTVLGIVFTALIFTSCTESTTTNNDEFILQTQAIDKQDSTTPSSDGDTGSGNNMDEN